METKKVIKIYCTKDKATREHMWYSHPNLRAQFDYLDNKDALPKKQQGKVTDKKE